MSYGQQGRGVPIEAAKIQPMGKGRSQPERQGKGVGRCGTVLVGAAAKGWIRRWGPVGRLAVKQTFLSRTPEWSLDGTMRMDGKWNGECSYRVADELRNAMAAIRKEVAAESP